MSKFLPVEDKSGSWLNVDCSQILPNSQDSSPTFTTITGQFNVEVNKSIFNVSQMISPLAGNNYKIHS